MKAIITFLVLLPRFGIACYLLWLGCRWLTATNNFADLILNAVALEFGERICPRVSAFQILPRRGFALAPCVCFMTHLAWLVVVFPPNRTLM